MQKVINVLAVLSFVGTAGAGTPVYAGSSSITAQSTVCSSIAHSISSSEICLLSPRIPLRASVSVVIMREQASLSSYKSKSLDYP